MWTLGILYDDVSPAHECLPQSISSSPAYIASCAYLHMCDVAIRCHVDYKRGSLQTVASFAVTTCWVLRTRSQTSVAFVGGWRCVTLCAGAWSSSVWSRASSHRARRVPTQCWHAHERAHPRIHTRTRTRTCGHTHTHTRARAGPHTHTHIRTNTHTRRRSRTAHYTRTSKVSSLTAMFTELHAYVLLQIILTCFTWDHG